jgi:hypothetical protein
MPTFKGTDFTIELPAEARDESTYAFAFRARSSFRPSVVVKTERLAAPTELPAYVEKQLGNIKTVLPNVVVVSGAPVKHGGLSAYTAVYDFGEESRRVRQKQRYILLQDPLRVVTLTGTSLKETFVETEPLFEAVFGSFVPGPSTVSGS